MELKPHAVIEKPTLCFCSYKNHKLVGACKREKGHFLYCLFCLKEILTFMFFSMYSILNKLSEYTYFYIFNNITIFCLFLKLLKAFSVSLSRLCDFAVNQTANPPVHESRTSSSPGSFYTL